MRGTAYRGFVLCLALLDFFILFFFFFWRKRETEGREERVLPIWLLLG